MRNALVFVAGLVLCSAMVGRAEEAAPSNPGMGFSTNFMDRSVEPGRDFYQYADGNWVKNNPVPPDQARWTAFIELAERNWVLAREILERAASNARPAGQAEREVGAFYAAAMDTNRIEQLGLEPLTPLLRDIDQAASLRDLFKALGGLHEQGIYGLFAPGVSPDARNSSIYAYELSQGGLSLPDRDYYLKDGFAAQRRAYRAHLAKMFGLLGEPEAGAANHADIVLDLETRIAKASRPRVDLRDPIKNYNKFATAGWFARNPGIPWAAYFDGCRLAGGDGATNSGALSTVPYVIAGQPEFFDALEKLLAERPLDDWKVYLRWHALHDCAPYLTREIERENFAFFGGEISGQPEQEPRWKRAGRVINGGIGEALGQLYVEKYYPPQAKARMSEMVENIKAAFAERLKRVDWMTDATRARALDKFARFTQKIGCPDTFRDYSAIELRRDDYFGDFLRSAAFETRRQLARVGKPVDKSEWHMTPITVNAYFSPSQNEIVFPAGILQPPFFDPSADDAVNYGGIGVVIGHEITHGYDDQGRKYDAEGNLDDWWTAGDAEAFEAAAKKVADEYDSFEALPGLHVNGTLTLGENLADLGGVAIARDALERALAKDPARRASIDGLTPGQRFYISFAQIWRSNIREAEQRRLILVDPHSPGRFRAVGPLLNFQAFYDAFGITSAAPIWLPPEKRAKIW
jgi:putative endopeptidase